MGKSKLDGTNVIQDYLSGLSAEVLGERYGLSDVAVRNYLRKHGVQIRSSYDSTYDSSRQSPYHFNEHWLDELDCAEKFYFLGFFAADGCNSKKYNNAKIKLQTCDLELLEKFKILLESDRPIYNVCQKRAKEGKEFFAVNFELTSKYFCEKLEELGLPERKTYTLQLPDYVPDKYFRDYIRGLFDGDGNISVSYANKPKGLSSIAGNPCFLLQVKEKLEKILPINIAYQVNNENCGYIKINRQEDIKIFLDWMYKDSKLYMERKYQKYLEFLSVRDFSVETVGQKRRRLKEQENEIINKYISGIEETKMICEQYQMSINTLYRILQRNNIKPYRENERRATKQGG